MAPRTGWKVGVDVGGTFTDAILYHEETGETYRAKTPSTPGDQSEGVIEAIKQIMSQLPNGDNIKLLSVNHGTTVATNAILEGKGARVALLVTEGYRDILQVRRSHVPGGLVGWIVWPKPEPLAPLEMTIEVPGRISTSGEIIRPFDAGTLVERLAPLKSLELPPESITVSLINSFANPEHELQVLHVLQSEFPSVPVSLSNEVLPEVMEYERTLTTVANAYVKPVVGKYLANLQMKLGETELRVLRSDGGLTSKEVATDNCCNLLYSGPAGGVAGVISQVAEKTRFKNLLTFDMGGTSTDVCLIENGVPELRRETSVADLTVRVPSVDVRTVGAGGGSIATVAKITGALRVGPESAGAKPGPACYAQGGTLPTVTDANVVLGYLPPTLLGGNFKLDVAAAAHAIEEHVAKPMGLTVLEAAEGILKLASERIYGSLRKVSVEKAKDPRNYALVAFGGAGGLAACELANLTGSYPVIIPPSPGVLCAFGDACTALRHEVSATIIRRLSDVQVEEIKLTCIKLGHEAAAVLSRQGIPEGMQRINWEGDLRYRGQSLTLPVSFVMDDMVSQTFTVLEERFTAAHQKLFTFSLDLEIELVNLRAVAEEIVRDVISSPLGRGSGTPQGGAVQAMTTIFYDGRHWTDVPIFERNLLQAGDHLPSPCIISETDANTLVIPTHRAEIDDEGNILIWALDVKPMIHGMMPMPEPEIGHVDPITVQLVEAALFNARNEMDTLIKRVAMSPAMREQLDYFPMIAVGNGPHEGKMVCGQFGSFIPGFLAVWDESIEEGDCFLTNDPYSVNASISHLNDFLVIKPVYWQGHRVAWVANFGHFTDIGSNVPGSMPNCATSIFEDGVQIPLCKLFSRGKPNRAVFKIIERNSRKPDFAKSDLHALVAATNIAGNRIQELCDRFGLTVYQAALDELLKRNKVAIGKLIKTTIPNEKIFFEDWIDDDGHGTGPWRVACTMSKKVNKAGDEIVTFDFDGTDPQSDRSINFALSHEMLKMFAVFYLLTVFDPSTVVNDGAYDLIDIKIPLGTILNPVRPAALSCRTHLLGRVFDVLGALFGQRQPEFLSAAGFSDSPHFFYSGWDKNGKWFQLYQIGFGGVPARPHGDGPDGHSMWPSMTAVPNEFLEMYLPLRVDKYETVPDSGGEGLYRGGNAMRIDYCFLEPGTISIHDDRWLTKPWGVHGGGTGARSSKILVKYSVDARRPPRIIVGSKEDSIPVSIGDVLEWQTWGGGGWGNPLDRDGALVAKEVRQGLVKNAARYGVVLDARMQLDVLSTEALRKSMRMKRGTPPIFNRGGSLKELLGACEEETGLPPPQLPSARALRGPVAQLPDMLELQARRAKEDAVLMA